MKGKMKNKKILPIYIKGLISGKYTLAQAAESTGYSKQWLCALKKKYLKIGNEVFINHHRGQIPVNKTPDNIRQKIVSTYKADYADVNFLYFCECLKEFENIKISYKTLSNILKSNGIKSPERRKQKVKHVHRPRLRRQCEGDMLQVDGTSFPWFYKNGDNKKYCLTGAIDDATGKITGLYLTENECLYGYMEILKQTCKNYGVPREIYSDRAAIFCFTPRKKNLARWEKLEVMHEKRTQWQRILSELNINQILARSPQAKGRIERMWHTIQGQLPVWFYKKGIKNIEEANKNLEKYINYFNSKYKVTPVCNDTFWLETPLNLKDILSAQFKRHGDKCGCITFQGTKFYCPDFDLTRKDILLCISEAGIFAKYKNAYYPLLPIGGYVQQSYGDALPQVVKNIIHRYLFTYAKKISG